MLGRNCHAVKAKGNARMSSTVTQTKRKCRKYCSCESSSAPDFSYQHVIVKQEVVSPSSNATVIDHGATIRNESHSETRTGETAVKSKKKGENRPLLVSNQSASTTDSHPQSKRGLGISARQDEGEKTDLSLKSKQKSRKRKIKIETGISPKKKHETKGVNDEQLPESGHRKKKDAIGRIKEKRKVNNGMSSGRKGSRNVGAVVSSHSHSRDGLTDANPTSSSSVDARDAGLGRRNATTTTTSGLNAEGETEKEGTGKRQRRVQFSAQNVLHENWRLSKEEMLELKNKGVKIRFGVFSKEETDLLRKNVDQFLKDHNLTDPKSLINRKSAPAELRAESATFMKTVAQGIDRPIFNIYRRLRRMYDPDHLAGKWTEEETNEMIRFYNMYPRQWTRIGKLIGRSGQAVAHRYTQNVNFAKEMGSSAPWSPDEIERLNGAVRAVTNTDFNTQITSQIPWVAVAEFVGTRTSNNCRQKWIRDICWVDARGKKEIKWTNQDDIELIKRLYEYDAVEEMDVDWLELSRAMPHSPSHDWLRTRWSILKRVVPDYQQDITFEDTVDYLYNRHLPILMTEKPTQASISAALIDRRYNEPGHYSRKRKPKK